MLLVACGAVGGRRCCWWPAVLLVAAGAVGGLRCCWWPSVLLAAPGSCACLPVYGLRPLATRSRTPQPPQSQLTPPQPHAQHAGFSQLAAGGRLMRQDAWQQQAAQRLSHSARRSVEDRPTAIRVCALATRRLPGSHAMPGTGGGRQCGERRCVQLCYAGRPSPHISQCCKYSTPLIPSRLPGRYVAFPLS